MNFTAFAAAVTASAHKNASAGIGILEAVGELSLAGIEDAVAKNHNKKTCSHSSGDDLGSQISSPLTYHYQDTLGHHAIGTNLSDLSVCWHKMSTKDECKKCGQTFYAGNQFQCENCDKVERLKPTSTLENIEMTLLKRIAPQLDATDLDDDSGYVASANVENDNDVADGTLLLKSEDLRGTDDNLTKRSFDEEFASLIVSTASMSSFKLPETEGQRPLVNATSLAKTTPFSAKDIIEQIKLYNKYNTNKFNELHYEVVEGQGESLNISGLLKIHWNLKNPIMIHHEIKQPVGGGFDGQTHFKVTSVRQLTQRKGWDDSSISESSSTSGSIKSNSSQHSNERDNLFRSHTVKCRSTKWKRAPLTQLGALPEKTHHEEETQNKMFIPAFASVSSIQISNVTTSLEAISILLDKYQIANASTEYSLYKVCQSGDAKELASDDRPLVERLWMGPFSEDKIFIMEKGRRLTSTQESANLLCLPESVLRGLVENLRQEEAKEEAAIIGRFTAYSDMLRKCLA